MSDTPQPLGEAEQIERLRWYLTEHADTISRMKDFGGLGAVAFAASALLASHDRLVAKLEAVRDQAIRWQSWSGVDSLTAGSKILAILEGDTT
jgi:hypothetical protein